MKAEIISIGTELLMGELIDTNAPFIASRLPQLGISLQRVSQEGDDLDTLSEAISLGLARSDIIFTSGGLGPTQDDLTREAIARALGETMVVQEDVVKALREYFRGRGTEMPATNIKQATLIPSARSLPNRRGTAPGWWVDKGGKIIVSMPGPPEELRGIWEEEVAPRLSKHPHGEVILTRNIKIAGISEGAVDELVSRYLGKENPYLGIYAKSDGIHLRIIARAGNEDDARGLIGPVEQGLVSIVGPYIWGYDDETPERAVGLLLTEGRLTLATMEYCTGGLLAHSITDVPGCRANFKGGIVIEGGETGHVWIKNGVPASLIEEHGIVSEEVAGAMALGVRERFGADIGIGITGAVEQMEDVPAGTIHIAIAAPGPDHGATDDMAEHDPRYYTLRLPPRPTVIKRRGASTALIELRRILNAR